LIERRQLRSKGGSCSQKEAAAVERRQLQSKGGSCSQKDAAVVKRRQLQLKGDRGIDGGSNQRRKQSKEEAIEGDYG